MTPRIVRVMIVDDSTVSRMNLTQILEADPRIRVVGAVKDGQAALSAMIEQPPDLVLMDVHMPGLNGFETTRLIMETNAVPIVLCSAISDPKDAATIFSALQAGAVACIAKPVGRSDPGFQQMAEDFRTLVRSMSEVRVVRRWAGRPTREAPTPAPRRVPGASALAPPTALEIIGIGASTGGPPLLGSLLARLPKGFPIPILIVQHIAPGFLPGMAEWLNQLVELQVAIGTDGEVPLPGHVYLAPDGFHMGVGPRRRLSLSAAAPEGGLRPSVAHLFRSLAETYGPGAAGVLLTGMGHDGAAELKLMRDRGATTIAQDKETSIVHGMPGAAIALGAATHVLPGEEIASALKALAGTARASGQRLATP